MRTEVVNRRGRELQARAVAVVDATGVTGRPWSGPARPVVPVVAPDDGTAGVVLPVDFSGLAAIQDMRAAVPLKRSHPNR